MKKQNPFDETLMLKISPNQLKLLDMKHQRTLLNKETKKHPARNFKCHKMKGCVGKDLMSCSDALFENSTNKKRKKTNLEKNNRLGQIGAGFLD